MIKKVFFLFLITIGCTPKERVEPIVVNYAAAYVVAADNSVSVIDLATQKVAATFQLKNSSDRFAHHIYASKTGNELAVALPSYDFSNGHGLLHTTATVGGVAILDAKTGELKKKWDVSFANHNAAISPNEKEVWTALSNHQGKLLVYDIKTAKLIKEIEVDADPTDLVFSTDGKFAFIAGLESSFVSMIDVATKETIKRIKVDLAPTGVWTGEAGKMYVENKTSNAINVIDIDKKTATEFIDTDFAPGFMKFNEETKELWVCGGRKNAVFVYKKINEDWQKIADILVGNDAHSLAFYNNFKKAIVVNQLSNSVHFVDCQTKEIQKELVVGTKPNGIVIIE